jgi:hypothetical protein
VNTRKMSFSVPLHNTVGADHAPGGAVILIVHTPSATSRTPPDDEEDHDEDGEDGLIEAMLPGLFCVIGEGVSS